MPVSTALEATRAKPRPTPYRLSFGDGLLLEVRPTGSKTWILRYMLAGKRRDMGLGPFPAVSLAEARHQAQDAARLASDGTDPLQARNAARAAVAKDQADTLQQAVRTFRVVAEDYVALQSPAWTSDKTLASWRLTLEKHAYPAMGNIPIADVARDHVIKTLTPIWSAQPPTARKLQRRISSILDYAAANKWRPADNPATGRVLRLTRALPAVKANGKRWPSLPWQRVPAFLVALEKQTGGSPLALRLAVLTGLRSNEIREARWSEFDLASRLWTIPGRRMKGGLAKDLPDHRVPLTPPVLDVLARAAALRTGDEPTLTGLAAQVPRLGDDLVFASEKGDPYSDATLGACIIRLNKAAERSNEKPWQDMDGRRATAHGFRRSFRSWVDDERPADSAAAEKALAHDEPNKVSAAYRGSDLLARRRDLMAAWGAYCGSAAAAGSTKTATAPKTRNLERTATKTQRAVARVKPLVRRHTM